jgi:hypothetical protein
MCSYSTCTKTVFIFILLHILNTEIRCRQTYWTSMIQTRPSFREIQAYEITMPFACTCVPFKRLNQFIDICQICYGYFDRSQPTPVIFNFPQLEVTIWRKL